MRTFLRNPGEMDAVLESERGEEVRAMLTDPQGYPVCGVKFNHKTLGVSEVTCFPFLRTHVPVAENKEEIVCVTDEKGNLLPVGKTRQQVREQNERYLVVSLLLFHGNEVLLQRRSPEKSIDPDMDSLSAHGVAKQLLVDTGKALAPVQSTDVQAMANTALELNEELRHGAMTVPFKMVTWPGTPAELRQWASEKKIDDPHTVYVIPIAMYTDDGYPLGNREKKRTRSVSAGFVFSKEKPEIVYDPVEVTATYWKKASEFKEDPKVSKDAQTCVDAVYDSLVNQGIMDGSIGAHMAKKSLRRLLTGEGD